MATQSQSQSQSRSRRRKRNPSFFKVMIGDFQKSIMIPEAFCKNHFEAQARPSKYTIEGPSGTCWDVTLKMVNEKLFFTTGWPCFVKHNSLEFGDFLVFVYLGGFKFQVQIFDKTGCQKESLSKRDVAQHQNAASSGQKPRNVNAQNDVSLSQKVHLNVAKSKPRGNEEKQYVGGDEINESTRNDVSWSQILCPSAALANPQADQGVIPRKSVTSGEISRVNVCECFRPADSSQGCQQVEKKDGSKKILEALQGKTFVPLDDKINGSHEDQKTNKRSSHLMEYQIDDSSIVKRRKFYFEQEEKGTVTQFSHVLGSRKSTRLLELEKNGKTVETCSRKELNKGVVVSAETEGISVHPDSVISDDMVKSEVIPVHSSDSEREDAEFDCNSRELVKPTEEVECHGLGVGRRTQTVSVHQDGLGSPIRNGSSDLTSMFQSENPSCKVFLARSYISRGFMHLSNKFVSCLTTNRNVKLNLKLHVANGRIWDVLLSCSERKSYLSRGWAAFVEENNLKEGDVCIFELVNKEKLDLKVSTYHKTAATPAKCSA